MSLQIVSGMDGRTLYASRAAALRAANAAGLLWPRHRFKVSAKGAAAYYVIAQAVNGGSPNGYLGGRLEDDQ